MRKFLVFFVLLFGVMCGAMAAGEWPRPIQGDAPDGGADVWWNNGSVELVVFFNTDDTVAQPVLTYWDQLLSEKHDDIGSIIIFGSADRQRQDRNPDANVLLSADRARWAIQHAVPDDFKSECTIGNTQNERCQVYAMGDANDYATSGYDADRDSNPLARSVHVRVIWRQEQCEQDTMDKINQIKTKLEQIRPQHTDKTGKINEALNIISQLNGICAETGTDLYASQSKNYSFLLSQLGTILVNLATTIPDISMLFQQSDFSAMFSTADIDLYYSRIQGLMGNRSVWRNTEGRFNTARLASDSIAGVVLGTIGGIVTSKLVKKNQLKQGFEDLSCNVGGQRVADYGDTFSIGLQ